MCVRVLLADPEEMLLEAYQAFLRRRGMDVDMAASGPVCVAKLHCWKPEVLVLEPEMPDGWGEIILAEVARESESERARVLILTRRDQSVEHQAVATFHRKPLSMSVLVQSIHAAAKQRPHSSAK